MLERNATVNKDLYILQLRRVNEALRFLADFWRNGFNQLVDRWAEVVNSNGEYIID